MLHISYNSNLPLLFFCFLIKCLINTHTHTAAAMLALPAVTATATQRLRLNSANRVRKLSLSRNGKTSAPRSSYPMLSSDNKRLNTSRPLDFNNHSDTCACAPQNCHSKTNFSKTVFSMIFMSWKNKKIILFFSFSLRIYILI